MSLVRRLCRRNARAHAHRKARPWMLLEYMFILRCYNRAAAADAFGARVEVKIPRTFWSVRGLVARARLS